MKVQTQTQVSLRKFFAQSRPALTALVFAISVSACSATGSISPQPAFPSGAPSGQPAASSAPSAAPTAAPSSTPAPSATPMPTPAPTEMPLPSPTATPVPTTPVTIYALVPTNQLRRFSSATPSTVTNINVAGIPAGQVLVGIDFRPADGKLYGVTNLNRMFVIDTNTGTASSVNPTAFTPAMGSPYIGFDFNPVVDRIRVQTLTGQNLRLNPVTGVTAATDTPLVYADGDINAGAAPKISGTAYTNSVSGATSTELYAIDSNRDTLVKMANPDDGKLNTVGPLGVNTNDFVGFDIAPDGRAFAALHPIGMPGSALYSINLATGTVTQIENIGSGSQVLGIAIAP